MVQQVLRVWVDGEDRSTIRRIWMEFGALAPGSLIEVELSNADWACCRVNEFVSDVLLVTRLGPSGASQPCSG